MPSAEPIAPNQERLPSRAPAVPVAVALAVGIALDRWLQPALTFWLAWSAALCLAWLIGVCRRRDGARLLSTFGLLAVVVTAGGARHHIDWSTAMTDDIAQFAEERPKPVRLRGVLETDPTIIPRKPGATLSAWTQYDRSICLLRCTAIDNGPQRRTVSGLARLEVTGHLLHARAGDAVEVKGRLSRPSGPQNPGEFDYRNYLRQQRVRCIVRTAYPEGVQRDSRPASEQALYFARGLIGLRDRIRSESEFLFVQHLSPRTVPVATALMLGSRGGLPDEVRTAFAESGTMHLLAISGLHVGILAALMWTVCRLVRLSPGATAFVLIAGVGSYAILTEVRPPVVRATILVFAAALAQAGGRRLTGGNTLAVAATIILAFRPTDLFDVGAQLSFLAAAAIVWSVRWQDAGRRRPVDPLSPPLFATAPAWFRTAVDESVAFFRSGYILTAAIWLFTAPLIAGQFHLVSPVGLLINVLLIPLVVATLWLGYGLLAVGLLLPTAAAPFAWGFDAGLSCLLAIADRASQLDLGHLYVPSIPAWWLWGFYAALAIVVVGGRRRGRLTRCGWYGVWSWLICGLAAGLHSPAVQELRCTFLSVGHGCAILLETPGGKTLLYDAGMISNGEEAQRAVQSALWESGRARIDAVVVSHADIDHMNGVPGLLRTVPVGMLLVSKSFLDFEQQGVREVCGAAAARNVPIRLICNGDRVKIDEAVGCRVLYPGVEPTGATDNANSVVLAVEFAGRLLLLTGDLEGEGLAALTSLPSRAVDVLLSPHHGSAGSNTAALAAWAKPSHVVVSKGNQGDIVQLRERFGPHVPLYATNECGAVTVRIDASGRLTCRAFVE